MAFDSNSLESLELLLTEFYSPVTDNARKKEIDNILTNFCSQPSAWDSCLNYMPHANNDHVLMFCLKVIETAISRRCMTFKLEEKETIRRACYGMLLSDREQSFFVRNKLVKLIVCIARFDWPQNYQSFLNELNYMLEQEGHVLLGINFVTVATEEFASSREDVSSSRRRELSDNFKPVVPPLMHKVLGILQALRAKVDQSPTSDLDLTNGLPHATSRCIEEKWMNILKALLDCLSNLLGWFEPSRGEGENDLLKTLFSVVVELSMRFLVSHGRLHCCPSQCRFQVAEMALNCICESLSPRLFSKLFSVDVYLHFVASSCEEMCRLLSLLENESQNVWQYLNEGRYLTKMIEFLHLLTKNYLKSFELDEHFFHLLTRFTFKQQPYMPSYISCLSMWSEFFEYLFCKKSDRFQCQGDVVSKYRNIIVGVAERVLKSIQLKNNQSHLETLDDDILDDDFKTEWQGYLLENTEVIVKASNLCHKEVFQCLNQPFEEALSTYFDLINYVAILPDIDALPGERQVRRLVITAENDCKKLHCMLRDLSTFLHIYAALADNFAASDFQEDVDAGCLLLQRLLSLMDYASKMRFHEVDSAIKNVLEPDFVEVHAQSLAAVKACCPFISHILSGSVKSEVLRQTCNLTTSTIFHSLLPLFQIELLPEKILLSASQLLLSFVTEVKPPLLDPSFHNIYVSGIAMTTAPPKALGLTYRALFVHLLHSLPTSQAGHLHDQTRLLLSEFCNFLFKDLHHVCEEVSKSESNVIVGDESANAVVQKTMEIMTEVVLNVNGVQSKKVEVCYSCLLRHIQRAVDSLFIFINIKETSCKIMAFFLAVVQTFRSQMGAELVKNILDRLMNLFSRKLIMDSLKEEESAGHELIEKLLQIFEVLVRDGSSQYKSLLPSILELCLQRIQPLIGEKPSPCVKPALFNLFFSALRSNWNVFFPNNSNGQQSQQSSQYQPYFEMMMTAYLTSLSQADVELVRQVVSHLESLNKQSKLYSKLKVLPFRNSWIGPIQEPAPNENFLEVFLSHLTSILVHKIHDLLHEDIVTAVFGMAAVDFNHFYHGFVPRMLMSSNLAHEYCRILVGTLSTDEDFPSFTKNMQTFLSDLRFLMNATLT